jgi:ferrochelatase
VSEPPTAVLLLAYGGPDSLEDVEPFLKDIRGGRPTSPELVAEVRERYARIGGSSPLLAITRAQAQALEEALPRDPEGQGRFRAFVGMRHWTPTIRQTVEEIHRAGLARGVALCMAPHFSRMSIGAYMARLDEALAEISGDLRFERVESWGEHPLFLNAVAEKVHRGLARFAPLRPGEVKVIFTAHSLPSRILEEGDPYEAQLRDTARRVAQRVAKKVGEDLDSCFAYQSAGASSIPWLGPSLEEMIDELTGVGRRNLLVAPIGFVADHVEILFDLDIEAREIASRAGARLERTESLNTDPTFIAALADVVLAAVGT